MRKKKPLTPDEVARRLRDPKTRVVMAPTEAVKRMDVSVTCVVQALKELLHIKNIWVSDESCISDLVHRSKRKEFYVLLGEKLGITLDLENPDDNFIIKIAARLNNQANA